MNANASSGFGTPPKNKAFLKVVPNPDEQNLGSRATSEQPGADHPDRDGQFQFIYRQVKRFQRQGEPVVSVDTKKKENIGNFSQSSREWEPQGQPRRTRTHDFRTPEEPKASPYGIYDLTQNEGWVNVGISHDTAQFAVAGIRGWWRKLGREQYPAAKRLLITADAGGSNGYRTGAVPPAFPIMRPF